MKQTAIDDAAFSFSSIHSDFVGSYVALTRPLGSPSWLHTDPDCLAFCLFRIITQLAAESFVGCLDLSYGRGHTFLCLYFAKLCIKLNSVRVILDHLPVADTFMAD